MVPGLLQLQLESKASSTVLKYKPIWLRWHTWVSSKTGVSVLPAKPLRVALFSGELTSISVENNAGVSPIESVVQY